MKNNISKLFVYKNYSIKKTLKIIDLGAKGIALLIDKDGALMGTITDGDIRRAILKGVSLEDSIENIIHYNPVSVKQSMTREEIKDIFIERAVKDIPIVDDNNKIIDKSVLNLKINKKDIFDKEKIIVNLQSIIKDLNKVSSRSKKILDDVKSIKKKGIKVTKSTIKILKKIKSNNNDIQKLDILNSLINPVINKVISRPEYRENNKDNELQKIEKLIEQIEPIYNAVIESSKEITVMINKLIGELEGEENE